MHIFDGLPKGTNIPEFGGPKPPWSGATAAGTSSPLLCSKTGRGSREPPGTPRTKTVGYFYIPPDPRQVPLENFWVRPNPGLGYPKTLFLGLIFKPQLVQLPQ